MADNIKVLCDRSDIVAIADAVRRRNVAGEMTLGEIAYSIGGIGNSDVVIDATLTQDGQAADSKAVGDAINEINETINFIMNILIDLDTVPVVSDDDGSVLAESDGTILINL